MWNPRLGVESAACGRFLLILACVCLSSCGHDFGYGGRDGPEHWKDEFQRCSGKYQSPINIDELSVEKKTFPDFSYKNIEVTPKAVHLTNNGHTVVVTMDFQKGMIPRMQGGPLERKAPYQLEQFHFHWGQNDTVGSEDLINNYAAPAELHVVLRNLEYPDFESALGKDHGIAVMAFFFKISEWENPYYGEFSEALSSIKIKGKSVDLVQPLPLLKFVSSNLENYFSYIGSLTTPPCAEKVVWIDYPQAIDISENQIRKFRELTGNDDHMKNNYRPTQKLNDRIVYEHVPIDPFMPVMSAIPFVDVENSARPLSYRGESLMLSCVVLYILTFKL